MTDIEILALINEQVTQYAAADLKQFAREIRALLSLKEKIEKRINASLNHQAQRELASRQ